MGVTPVGVALIIFLAGLLGAGCRAAHPRSITLICQQSTDESQPAITADAPYADQGDWDDSRGKRTGTAEGAAVIGQGDATSEHANGALQTDASSGGDSADAGRSVAACGDDPAP